MEIVLNWPISVKFLSVNLGCGPLVNLKLCVGINVGVACKHWTWNHPIIILKDIIWHYFPPWMCLCWGSPWDLWVSFWWATSVPGRTGPATSAAGFSSLLLKTPSYTHTACWPQYINHLWNKRHQIQALCVFYYAVIFKLRAKIPIMHHHTNIT